MKILSLCLAISLLAHLSLAVAQQSGTAAVKNPADPRAEVAPLPYKSPFAGYRPFAGGTVGPWKDVNDEVARIGGWKAYAREAYEASKQAAPPDGAASASAAPQEPSGPKGK